MKILSKYKTLSKIILSDSADSWDEEDEKESDPELESPFEGYVFVDPTPNELRVFIKEYARRFSESDFEDIKLVKDKKDKNKELNWSAVALKFKSKDTDKLSDIIELIVNLKPDEYWGSKDEYHVFWWD